ATLVVIKHVINNDGGQALAGEFTMSVGGGATNVQPSASFPGAEAPGTTVKIGRATGRKVGETGRRGYTSSASADCAGTSIPNGETRTCTVTNDDQPATLVVIKHVINNNGGPADASDFTMTVGGGATNVQPSASFPGAEAPGTTV